MITEEMAYKLQSKDALNYFLSIKESLSDYDYWVILRALWIDAGKATKEWHNLFKADRKQSHKIMKSSDRQALKNLAKKITIYRGCCSKEDEDKFNWTTKKDIAIKFRPFSGYVAEKVINKNEILAYFNSRNEFEIILK